MKFFNILLIALCATQLSAQSYVFGAKGGLSVGNQSWNEGERNLLYKYHGIGFIETVPTTGNLSVFAQLGYHIRGSAIRTRPYKWIDPNTFSLIDLPATLTEFQFKNIALTVGTKQKDALKIKNAFYGLGIRAEYTVGTSLGNSNYIGYFVQYPVAENVKHFNYGVYLSGGMEFPFSEFIGGVVELSISPDISRQYFSPEIRNVIIRNEYDERNGQTVTLPAQTIRNVTIELSLGIKFLRKIIYVE
jgi:hypothetical protein